MYSNHLYTENNAENKHKEIEKYYYYYIFIIFTLLLFYKYKKNERKFSF